jgi:hypothetical protein
MQGNDTGSVSHAKFDPLFDSVPNAKHGSHNAAADAGAHCRSECSALKNSKF